MGGYDFNIGMLNLPLKRRLAVSLIKKVRFEQMDCMRGVSHVALWRWSPRAGANLQNKEEPVGCSEQREGSKNGVGQVMRNLVPQGLVGRSKELGLHAKHSQKPGEGFKQRAYMLCLML